jgi:hypothetical protein
MLQEPLLQHKGGLPQQLGYSSNCLKQLQELTIHCWPARPTNTDICCTAAAADGTPNSCVACPSQAGHCLAQAQVRPEKLSLTMIRSWSLLAMWVHFLAGLPSMRLQEGKRHPLSMNKL